MKTLFPDIRPFHSEQLDVGQGHRLYVERCGSESGIPVLVVHGGPGAGCSEKMRRFFDPEQYHIIIFDQRGAGRSSPHAETEHNDNAAVLADMELIRQRYGISRWVLFGGSYGATLSLLYAQAHPEKVAGLILRGVFLGREQDLNWLYEEGAGRYFPEEWQRFLQPVDGAVGHELIEKYYQILHGPNELAKVSAAKAWARWEVANASFRPNQSSQDYYTATHTALSMARISSHFFRHRCFLNPNQIIDNVDKIAHIPAYILHGRYDMICPPEQAWALAEAWPEAELDLVREGGHSAFDPAMTDVLIRATRRLAKRLGVPESEA